MLACGVRGELWVILQLRVKIVHTDIQESRRVFDMEIWMMFLFLINLRLTNFENHIPINIYFILAPLFVDIK